MRTLAVPLLACVALFASIVHAQSDRPKDPGRAPAIDPGTLILTPVRPPHLLGAKIDHVAKEVGESAKFMVECQAYIAALKARGGPDDVKRIAEAERWYEEERAFVVKNAADVSDWAARTDSSGKTTADKLRDKSDEQRFRDPHE